MKAVAAAAAIVAAGSAPLAHSDEGMWLFNDSPRKLLQERYGSDLRGRNIALHARAITEALRRVYGAQELVQALVGK